MIHAVQLVQDKYYWVMQFSSEETNLIIKYNSVLSKLTGVTFNL